MAAHIANPHRGNLDPDAAEGKKMITKMITGLPEDDKFDMKQENTIEFRDNLEEAANQFCFGNVLHAIPVAHDAGGNIAQTTNLLTEPNLCSTTAVIDFAQNAWGNTNGDFRIDSDGTAETDPVALEQRKRTIFLGLWLKNSLTKEGKKKLMLQKRKFCHYCTGNNANAHEDYGSTIVRIMFEKCDPTKKSGIKTLKMKLGDFTLEEHDQNLTGVLDYAVMS